MGQGSRGGNGGVTSSGGRVREDKALKDAEKTPKTVSNREKKQTPEDRQKKQKEQTKKDSQKNQGNNRRGRLRMPRGRLFRFPHFASKGSKGSGKSGSNYKKPNTPASNIQNKNKIPTIKRVQGPKVKLTKQRGNKAPN